ncbi:hypothetical protein QE152_g889 [Popillia japonica]|uniref:Uncharacterized protein n=1 Tax=Popillia japonica TaxID=7064 RepID=A0AAW1N4T2_POPJA
MYRKDKWAQRRFPGGTYEALKGVKMSKFEFNLMGPCLGKISIIYGSSPGHFILMFDRHGSSAIVSAAEIAIGDDCQ